MKRNSFLILCALILSLGISAFAQNGAVNLVPQGTTLVGPNMRLNSDPVFSVIFDNSAPVGTGERVNVSNGFVVSSPDGAVWNSAILDSLPPHPAGENFMRSYFNQVWAMQSDGNGSADGPDTFGVFGAGNPSGTRQLPDSVKTVAELRIDLDNNMAHAGKHICIDSADANGELWNWKWVTRTLVDKFPTFTVVRRYLRWYFPERLLLRTRVGSESGADCCHHWHRLLA